MSDSRRPYRVYPNGETQLFDIWTRADETPGSLNNYIICGNFQDPIEADEFCAAVNNIQEITKQRDQLLEACKLAAATFATANGIQNEECLDALDRAIAQAERGSK